MLYHFRNGTVIVVNGTEFFLNPTKYIKPTDKLLVQTDGYENNFSYCSEAKYREFNPNSKGINFF